MKKLVKEINAKNNLDKNLNEYVNRMAFLYNQNSSVRLSMNYYIYYQMLFESKTNNKDLIKLADEVDLLIDELVVGNGDSSYEDRIAKANNTRAQILAATELLTEYTDEFSLFEHLLNRVEYRFKELPEHLQNIVKIEDDNVTRDVMRYILEDEENSVINAKIAEVVRELPVRMTKQHFFELLEEGIRVYKTSTVDSVNDFLYMIRSTATIHHSDNHGKYDDFADIEEIMNHFNAVDFATITENDYDKLRDELTFVSQKIENLVSVYMLMAEIVNDAIAIGMSDGLIVDANKSTERLTVAKIVQMVKSSSQDILDEVTEDFTEIFESLEGVQEELGMTIPMYEFVLDMAKGELLDKVLALGLKDDFDKLSMISGLSSTNLFIDFNKVKNNEIITADELDKVIEKVICEFKEFFNNHNRSVNRTVMAITLSVLPVFFNNISEIQDYIYNSISQCKDMAEKIACKELLYSLNN